MFRIFEMSVQKTYSQHSLFKMEFPSLQRFIKVHFNNIFFHTLANCHCVCLKFLNYLFQTKRQDNVFVAYPIIRYPRHMLDLLQGL